VIELYMRTDALLYVDPPYVRSTLGTDRMYVHDMTDEEHVVLLDALDRHLGPVLLSAYPSPMYSERLAHWTLVTTSTRVYRGALRVECLWLNPVVAQAPRQQRLALGGEG
jgi:DNA adenine methylase